MSQPARRALVLGLVAAVLFSLPIAPVRAAHAEEPAAGGGGFDAGRAAVMAVDVFPIRFGGFLRTVVGGVFLVPVTLLSAATYPFERNPSVFRENAELYVVEPFEYTFRRPLGEDLAGS
ncbi:MAG: hypothetical protein R3F21_04725 [Myxococcota bacterium]